MAQYWEFVTSPREIEQDVTRTISTSPVDHSIRKAALLDDVLL